MLRLRINKYLDSGNQSPPMVLGNVFPITKRAGTDQRADLRKIMIPISVNQSVFALVDLGPGLYYVEAAMPSGQVLTDSVEIVPGRDAELVFTTEESPNEWLSWHHFMGNVAQSYPQKNPIERSRFEAEGHGGRYESVASSFAIPSG